MQEFPWRQQKELTMETSPYPSLPEIISISYKQIKKFGREDYKVSNLEPQVWGDLIIQKEFLRLVFQSHIFLDTT